MEQGNAADESMGGGGAAAGAAAAAGGDLEGRAGKRQRSHTVQASALGALASAMPRSGGGGGGGGGGGARSTAGSAGTGGGARVAPPAAPLGNLAALRSGAPPTSPGAPAPPPPPPPQQQQQQLMYAQHMEHRLAQQHQRLQQLLQAQAQGGALAASAATAAAAAAAAAPALTQGALAVQLQLAQQAVQQLLAAHQQAEAAARGAAAPLALDPQAALASALPLVPYFFAQGAGPRPVGPACDPLQEAALGNIPASDQAALRDWAYMASAHQRPGQPAPTVTHLTDADLLRWLQRDGGREWEASDARRILRLYDEPLKEAVPLPWMGPESSPQLGTIEWFEWKSIHRELSAFRARFQLLKTPGFFNTLLPERLAEFLSSELGAAPLPGPQHAPAEAAEILGAAVANLVQHMGAAPVSEARFLRLMVRIKCALQAQRKEVWRLSASVHCPLCALKLVSYVL